MFDQNLMSNIPLEGSKEDNFDTTLTALGREVYMLGSGVGQAFKQVVSDPEKMAEAGLSVAAGTALGVASRVGTPGKIIAGTIGATMAVKFAYDELTGNRWCTFGGAISNTWRSGARMQENIDTTRDSIGSLVVDTVFGAAGFRAGKVFSKSRDLTFKKIEGQPDHWADKGRDRSSFDDPLYRFQQTFSKFVPARSFASDIQLGKGPYFVPAKDGLGRIVADKMGRINHIQLPDGATSRDLARLTSIGGFARLVESDALAWQEAKSSTLLSRLGLTSKKSVAENAIRGSAAFIDNRPGNRYTEFLNNRFGYWTEENKIGARDLYGIQTEHPNQSNQLLDASIPIPKRVLH